MMPGQSYVRWATKEFLGLVVLCSLSDLSWASTGPSTAFHSPESVSVTARDLLSIPPDAMRVALKNEARGEQLRAEFRSLALDRRQNYTLRWKALSAFSEMPGADTIPTLQSACQAPEWFMKNSCLMNLHRLKAHEAVTESMNLLHDPALVVRSQAVETLIADGEATEVRPALWHELDQPRNFHRNKSLWIRKQILDFLSQKPMASERSQWSQLAYDPDPKIKHLAQNALSQMSVR